jgi:ABC-type transporter Mla subunit MlaD
MNVVRQEIRTGLLVIFSLVVLVGVLLYLGSPGIFHPMKTYFVFVKNGAGIKPGADVLLAGRRIGQVRRLSSPVARDQRPDPEKKMETRIEVRVDRDAKIYGNVKVTLRQYGLLSDMIIDFTSGDEQDGLAPGETVFLGELEPGLSDAIPKVLDELHPAIVEATETLKTLQKTADSISALAGPGGEVPNAVSEFKKFGGNLNELTGPESSLRHSLLNLQVMTGEDGKLNKTLDHLEELTNPAGPLSKTLKNAEKFTSDLTQNQDIYATLRNLKLGSAKLDNTLGELGGKFSIIGSNLEQASDTVKRQPWRLIWPSTKKYAEPTPAPAAPAESKRRR